jgi:hypothetical protein
MQMASAYQVFQHSNPSNPPEESVKMVYCTIMFAVVHNVVHVEELDAGSALAEQNNVVQTQDGE